MFRVGILTISDRGAAGKYEDRSGPVIREVVQAQGWTVAETDIVPDDREHIQAALLEWADDLQLDLILTTGGTGFAPRDITPEATRGIIEREAPGLAEAMRAASLKVTPHAMLSRSVAGMRGRTLIVNLPGSPKAVRENLDTIMPALPHGLALLREQPGEDQRH